MNRSLLWQAALLALVMACALPSPSAAASRDLELNGGFTLARLKYTGGGDWYSDESSLRNLLRSLKERGDVRVSQDHEAVVTPTDPEIWNYPMLFMTGHGNIKLSEEEARALRSYPDSGGLLDMHLADDLVAILQEQQVATVFRGWPNRHLSKSLRDAHGPCPSGICDRPPSAT